MDPGELRQAVELQRKTYGLLRWIGEAVRDGALSFDRAHEYATAAESMREWLVSYSRQVPGRWRPRMSDPEEVTKFVHLFTSYLFTSVELVEEPGLSAMSRTDGCLCDLCRRLVAASHVKPRRLRDRDKQRALALEREYLEALAAECGRRLTASELQAMLASAETATALAPATYGTWLVRRCRGDSGDPALLALWRRFAWTAGAPRKDFELTAELMLDSEQKLVERLRAGAGRTD